jgi:hypothetical protein
MRLLWAIRRAWKLHVMYVQCCHRCGGGMCWWGDPKVWMAVVGEPYGHYCIRCFDWLATKKGVWIDWSPYFRTDGPTPYRDAIRVA